MSANALVNQQVLVTRPQQQQAKLCALLAYQGAVTHSLPCIEIERLDPHDSEYQASKNHMMNIDLFDIVICISANAAHCAGEWLDQYWPQLPLGISWYAIGVSTKAALQHYDIFAKVAPRPTDSEALLSLHELLQVTDKRVLLLKGCDGRDTLFKNLKARGAQVEEAVLYRRKCAVYSDELVLSTLYNTDLSAILTTSGEALCNLVAIAKGSRAQFDTKPLLATPIVVPSQRVATIASTHGFNRITVAAGADDQAMLIALLSANDSEAKYDKT